MTQDIITILGIYLSKKLDIKTIATKGLIRLALKDDYGDYIDLNLKKMKDMIWNGLKKRLERLNIQNLSEVLDDLDKELIKHQSIISMEKF